MNARGLIELILLNTGLQAAIITPTLFTILVLVAIVTTLMATPIFEFVYGGHRVNDPPAATGALETRRDGSCGGGARCEGELDEVRGQGDRERISHRRRAGR